MTRRCSLLVALPLLAFGCRPAAPPITGTAAPAALPKAQLPPVHLKYVFKWLYFDGDTQLSGDGAARISPPDSVRLDFFVARGMGSGHVMLIGDSLRTPGPNQVKVLVPPPPLLWASLGRLDVPRLPDTLARAAGDTLRVELSGAGNTRWRTTFVATALREVSQLVGSHIEQFVTRDPEKGTAHYEHRRGRRLDITLTRVDTVPGFDVAIWQ